MFWSLLLQGNLHPELFADPASHAAVAAGRSLGLVVGLTAPPWKIGGAWLAGEDGRSAEPAQQFLQNADQSLYSLDTDEYIFRKTPHSLKTSFSDSEIFWENLQYKFSRDGSS